jgi:hypothetical protein
MSIFVREGTDLVPEAIAVVDLYHQFEDYLRSLGDTSAFNLTVENYFEYGFGEDPAFKILLAGDDTQKSMGFLKPVGFLMYNVVFSPYSTRRQQDCIVCLYPKHPGP